MSLPLPKFVVILDTAQVELLVLLLQHPEPDMPEDIKEHIKGIIRSVKNAQILLE